MFTYKDVIKRAIRILKRRKITPYSSRCTEYCPWCAIAEAKGELDREHDTGLSYITALFDMEGNRRYPSDMPLIEAGERLKKWAYFDDFNKKDAINILKCALRE